MTAAKGRYRAAACMGAALALASCGNFGKVEQGRVIAYDAQARRVTLIRTPIRTPGTPAAPSPGILPPLTIETPTDPNEMGPAPAAGELMLLDSKNRTIVIYDRASQSFRTIRYTLLGEVRNVARSPGAPVVDRARQSITLYAPEAHALITFAASAELLAMPANTWRAGDVVRYYYRDPARALRLMNVTQTDLSKSSG